MFFFSRRQRVLLLAVTQHNQDAYLCLDMASFLSRRVSRTSLRPLSWFQRQRRLSRRKCAFAIKGVYVGILLGIVVRNLYMQIKLVYASNWYM